MSFASDAALRTLAHKLERKGELSADERQAVMALPVTMRVFEAGQDILRDGDQTTHCALMVEGWSYSYQTLAEGRRQILSFHLPGDAPDLLSLHLDLLDHSLAALTVSTVALIPYENLRETMHRLPSLGDRLWRENQVHASALRSWATSMGRRSAYGRVAHLFCELYLRQVAAGLAEGCECLLPLRQPHLADATGLTTVHINRTLSALRMDGLITLKGRKLMIHDLKRLFDAAEFDPRYLHLPPHP